MNLQEEKALIEKSRKNPQAFGKIYDAYFSEIFGYVFKRVGDFDFANDITSEVFLKAYVNLWRFRWQKVSIAAWLYRIATNEVNGFFRKKNYAPVSLQEMKSKIHFDPVDPQSLETEKAVAEKLLKEHEDFLQIQQILMQLPIKYQEVISLRYFEKKSIKEIGQILNKKQGTVKSLISRGLSKVREEMREVR